jgi:hypothetical protein
MGPAGPDRAALLTVKVGRRLLTLVLWAGETSCGASITIGVKTSKLAAAE